MGLEVGGVLRGKYLIDAPIGQGGMGEVFAATDLAEGGRVAIKVVRRATDDAVLMARLQREAEASFRVQSPYVAELFAVDTTEDGELFLVMELLEGETLAQRLAEGSAVLPWSEVRSLGTDVLRGLVDAHAAGVVHRDLKPGNVFLEAREGAPERAKILDFGVCKLERDDGAQLTTTGEAVGTIAYMAPEQIRGASTVDERADIYAFAMLVYEALAGRLPYEASGQIAMIASKLERPARSLREVSQAAFPVELDALLARCLARRPEERPARAMDLLQEWLALGPATYALGPPARVSTVAWAVDALVPIVARRAKIGLVVAACALLASSAAIVVALRARTNGALPRTPPSASALDASAPPARVPKVAR